MVLRSAKSAVSSFGSLSRGSLSCRKYPLSFLAPLPSPFNFRSFRALQVVLHAHFLPWLFPPPFARLSDTRVQSRIHDVRVAYYMPTPNARSHTHTHMRARHTPNGLHGRRNKIIASALRSKVNLREGGRAVKLTFAWPALSFTLYCRAAIDLRESRRCLASDARFAV